MTALIAIILKECRLLARDIHGLLLLFVMPVVFILIMSLALQDQFAQQGGGRRILVLVDNRAGSEAAATALERLQQREAFAWELRPDLSATVAVQRDEAAFLLTLEPDGEDLKAGLLVAPGTTPQVEALLTASVGEVLGRQRLERLLRDMKTRQALRGDFSLDDNIDEYTLEQAPVQVRYSYQRQGQPRTEQPTSVQQSVPAWLVFAMFFSVVPLSNTLITERQQGTLRRLRTLPVSPFLPLIGKWLPYFAINQVQVVLMLAVGVYLMPLLGADRLTLGHSFPGLALMAASVSVAALGYGLLIAAVALTTEQATTLGGVGNILLAALGGVMVPRFVMPEAMQQVSGFSPMAWGLEGFLDLLLRGGSVADVLVEAGSLLLFGSVNIALAMLVSLRRY